MFVFRFEAVLTARTNAEELRRRALAEAERALVACREALRESRRRRKSGLIEFESARRTGCCAGEIPLHLAYLERLEEELRERARALAAAEQKVHRCRRELLEAVKARRMLEKLRERELAAYEAGLAASERKFLDEVAGRRAFDHRGR